MQVCKDVDRKVTEVFEETIEKVIKQVDDVCEDLPWPLDWVCHAVVTLITVVEVVVKTVVRVYSQLVCYPVTFAATALAQAAQWVLAIPGLGTWIKAVVGAIVNLWSQAIGWIDAGLGLLGILPIKHLRLEVFILMHPDTTLTVQPAVAAPMLSFTETVFRNRANIKVHTTVHQADFPATSAALTIGTEIDPGIGLMAEDTTEAGTYFQALIAERLGEDSPWFVFKLGAPIVAFVVDTVEGTYTGCSAGIFLDYICVEGASLSTVSTLLAHEMGHALGLQHDSFAQPSQGDPTNLMYYRDPVVRGIARGNNLSPFQRGLVRSSPHVTYV